MGDSHYQYLNPKVVILQIASGGTQILKMATTDWVALITKLIFLSKY